MITKAPPRVSTSGPPTQAQIDLWNTMCEERGRDDLKVSRFKAGTRFKDVSRLIEKLKLVSLLPGVTPAKPDPAERTATDNQVAYILRLQAQVGDEIGVPEDLLFDDAREQIDRLKARRT